jgi:hypothetical protein
MPSKSAKQHRWVASAAGLRALGPKKQKEWLKADKGRFSKKRR